jgi:hypothetical protein
MWTEFIWFRTGVSGRNLWTSNEGDIPVGNFRPAANLLWTDSAKGSLFSESRTPELILLIFSLTCVITVWKEAYNLHTIKINRASATIEWRYTSTLPDIFMTCTDTALQFVCQVAREIWAGLVLCQGLRSWETASKLVTKLPFQMVYFLGVRGLTTSFHIVYDYTISGHMDL